MLQNGTAAPAFNLVDTDKNPATLEDYTGKSLVLLFFPFAFTSTCTEEMCMTRDDIGSYNELGSEVLAVSVDSPDVLRKFKEEYNLSFRLGSDFNKDAIRAYGIVNPVNRVGLREMAKRSVFVIDKKGVIRHLEVLENPSLIPDFGKVKDALKGLLV